MIQIRQVDKRFNCLILSLQKLKQIRPEYTSNDFKNSREHALKKGDTILPRMYMEIKGVFAIENVWAVIDSTTHVLVYWAGLMKRIKI